MYQPAKNGMILVIFTLGNSQKTVFDKKIDNEWSYRFCFCCNFEKSI